jgi:parallel beta-helix repeat protein
MAPSRKAIGIFSIAAICAICALVLTMGVVSATDIPVGPGETYTTIQSAVAIANPFDTIIVHDDTYTENVNVNVDNLTIHSENGFESCIVQAGNPDDHVFDVTAAYVNISGFTVTGATGDGKSGIYLSGVAHCNISNNNASNNLFGIYLYSSNNNNLTNNTANANSGFAGIGLENSSYNKLENNTANNNVGFEGEEIGPPSSTGICILGSHNLLMNNTASNNYIGIGVFGGGPTGDIVSINNTIEGNTVMNNTGIFFGNKPLSGGIILGASHNNTIRNNTASSNFLGVAVYFGNYNLIAKNIINFNTNTGIILSSSNNNTISYNNASSNCDIGIELNYSSYNDLINNTASTNGQYGIWLRRSPQNILRRNAMDHNGKFNLIHAESPNLEWWNDDIDTSNTVNGLPVYYIYNKSDFIIDNYATKKLSIVGCENITVKSINYSDGDPITLSFTNNSRVEKCTVSNNNAGGFLLIWSNNNKLANNSALNNEGNGIFLQADSSHNSITNNIITGNGQRGIELQPPTSNNCIYNNYFDNTQNAYDNGNNVWNITKTEGSNIIGGPNLGGNYWSDYTGTDADGDGLGDIPHNIPSGTNKDYLPLIAPPIFDTSKGDYPSISGTHNGTIKLNQTINVSKIYTYPCVGTGGHTEYVKIWNSTDWNVTATWNGYTGDWHDLTFNNSFTLYENETYNYTIVTGSYPQIIHSQSHNATGGVITCAEFVDANGKRHEGWIPAIRLD